MSFKPEIYAIDFGTSNSLLAAANSQGCAEPLAMTGDGSAILKSVMFAAEGGQWFYGATAIEEYMQRPYEGRVFKSLKRFLPEASFTSTAVFNRKMSLADLLAKLIHYMRQRANQHYGCDIRQAVLGCPALFSEKPEEHQLACQRLHTAALQAGFEQVELLPEPIAAAYRFQSQLSSEKLVLVADFGGGTSDFTVQRMSQRPFRPQDVLAIHGISIAGDRYDGALMQHFVAPQLGTNASYQKPSATRPSPFPIDIARMLCSPADLIVLSGTKSIARLQQVQRWLCSPTDQEKIDQLITLIEDRMGYAIFKQIEASKVALSTESPTNFSFDYAGIALRAEMQRSSFEQHSANLTNEIMKALDNCLSKAQIKADDIDIVCLTGGTSYLPAIRQQLHQRFGDKLATSSQFDSVVAGLAQRGQQILTS